jgi:hypothetical protein
VVPHRQLQLFVCDLTHGFELKALMPT